MDRWVANHFDRTPVISLFFTTSQAIDHRTLIIARVVWLITQFETSVCCKYMGNVVNVTWEIVTTWWIFKWIDKLINLPTKTSPESCGWWPDGMDMVSTLLALCEGNPPVAGGFPTKRANIVELWYFLCSKHKQAIEQTVEWPVNLDAMTLMWHHSDVGNAEKIIWDNKPYTVECRYNAVHFITILLTALKWQQQNVSQTWNTTDTPYLTLTGRAMGCLLWGYWK